ncbi:MAG: hypothetical protein ACM3JD_02200 [Rudaea sp.]
MSDLADIIRRLEQQKAAIDRALTALCQIGGSADSSSAAPSEPEPAIIQKRGITPAGRKKLSEALRRRWAEKRASQAREEQAEKYAQAAQKRRATLARKRMSEAMKQRWAAKRALAASQQRAVKKVTASKKNTAPKKQPRSKIPLGNEEQSPTQA